MSHGGWASGTGAKHTSMKAEQLDASKKAQALIRRTRRSGVFETITLRVLRRAELFAAAITIS